jgi:hypothetical protein
VNDFWSYNPAQDTWLERTDNVTVVGSNPLPRHGAALLDVAGQLLLLHGMRPGIAPMLPRLWHQSAFPPDLLDCSCTLSPPRNVDGHEPQMRRVLMVSSSPAGSGEMNDVKTFTEATATENATWGTLWLDGDGAVQGTPPSQSDFFFLAADSKLWFFGGDYCKSKHPIGERLVQNVVVGSTVREWFRV